VSRPQLTGTSTVVAAGEHASANVEDEAVILDLQAGVYYGLNPVGVRVWELVQEPRTVAEVCDAIVSEYDVERDRCERDVVEVLRMMAESGLVRVSDAPGR
jgi:Coenzyme PQQ synthesis protein D (PqqD)